MIDHKEASFHLLPPASDSQFLHFWALFRILCDLKVFGLASKNEQRIVRRFCPAEKSLEKRASASADGRESPDRGSLTRALDRFPEGSSLPETSSILIQQGFELCPFFLESKPVDQIQEAIGIELVTGQ